MCFVFYVFVSHDTFFPCVFIRGLQFRDAFTSYTLLLVTKSRFSLCGNPLPTKNGSHLGSDVKKRKPYTQQAYENPEKCQSRSAILKKSIIQTEFSNVEESKEPVQTACVHACFIFEMW